MQSEHEFESEQQPASDLALYHLTGDEKHLRAVLAKSLPLPTPYDEAAFFTAAKNLPECRTRFENIMEQYRGNPIFESLKTQS